MIRGTLANRDSSPLLRPFNPIFSYLQGSYPTEPGRYEIDRDQLFVIVSDGLTRAPSDGNFEAHRRYVDLQFVASGSERMGVCPIEGLKVKTPYEEEKDLIFFENPSVYDSFVVQAGQFAVFYPEDAHLPSLHTTEVPNRVVKLVFKIALNSIKPLP